MTLRTSHRRISPRARRRYRTIRNFFRWTFNSLTSPTSMRISSSIAVNAADLKQNVVYTENTQKKQIENYRDLYGDGDFPRRDMGDSTLADVNGMDRVKKQKRLFRDGLLEGKETNLLYKTSDNLYTTSHDIIFNSTNESDRAHDPSKIINNEDYDYVRRVNLKRDKHITPHEYRGLRSKYRNKTRRFIENSMSDLGSSDSLAGPFHQNSRDPEFNGSWCIKQQKTYDPQFSPSKIKTKKRKHKTKLYRSESPPRPDKFRYKKLKNKAPASSEHFIINEQYKPLNLFGRRASEFSKISYPVCRDTRHSNRELELADSDVEPWREPATGRRQACHINSCNIRSMCDTRFYDSHRQPRLHPRQCFDNNYNDSRLYDVFPVKEKSSPKSRRKFIEDNMVSNQMSRSPNTQRLSLSLETPNYSDNEENGQPLNESRRRQSLYHRKTPKHVESFKQNEFRLNEIKEVSCKFPMRTKRTPRLHANMGAMISHEQYDAVPPSPRTHRPQLNLEVQNYSNNEDFEQQQNQLGRRHETLKHTLLDEFSRNRNNCASTTMTSGPNNDKLQPDMDSQKCLELRDNATIKKDECQSGNKADQTDTALHEIKNILQSFLLEVKKDSSTTKSDDMNGTFNENDNIGKPLGSPRGNGNETSNTAKNSTASSFNCGFVHGAVPIPTMPTQFMPSFGNPCCYPPMMHVHDARLMPCLQNSCGVLNCMCVGASCNHQSTDEDSKCRRCSRISCAAEVEPTQKESETDELIRAIYKYVVQKPENTGMSKNSLIQGLDARLSKSMGKSMHALRQDAKVGTPPLRYAKSCEAISSAQLFGTYYPTNPSYSDSLLEKISHEDMDFVLPYKTNEHGIVNEKTHDHASKQQPQNSKFISALRFLRNKKSKKGKIHEVCKSEQSMEVDVMPKRGYHFQQELAAYTIHSQEFLHPPPQPHSRISHPFNTNYPPYDARVPGYQIPLNERHNNLCYDFGPIRSPVYESQSQHNISQRPLYLKEIEVRSIGTQSEKKIPYFRFFPQKNKTQTSLTERHPTGILREGSKNYSTQPIQYKSDKTKSRKLFDLKKPVGKWETEASMSEKIVKDFTKNDTNLSNAMLKKIFYKRNPFSPQNRFVRTIMEKDTPVVKWRPRFFV